MLQYKHILLKIKPQEKNMTWRGSERITLPWYENDIQIHKHHTLVLLAPVVMLIVLIYITIRCIFNSSVNRFNEINAHLLFYIITVLRSHIFLWYYKEKNIYLSSNILYEICYLKCDLVGVGFKKNEINEYLFRFDL